MTDETQEKGGSEGPPMIEADGLSKFYGIFAATQDVSFSIRQGEVVAFLGPNGAGKSTTMKLLTGYLAPSQGVARIAGHDMATDRLAGSIRLGYLPGEWSAVSRYDALLTVGIFRYGPRHVARAKRGADRGSDRSLCVGQRHLQTD